MKSITKNLKDGYNELILRINLEDLKENSLKFSIKGEDFFITLFVYAEDEIVGSITTNRDTERYMSKNILKSSNGFKALKSGDYKIAYILHKKSDVILKIEEKNSDLNSKDEISITEDEVKCEEEKWYAGDFHTHTFYSDGKLSREENIKIAKDRGLSFFAPTDHNFNHSKFPKSDLLIIEGTEITSKFGHINLFFTNESIFSKFSVKGLNTEDWLKEVLKNIKGEIYSINHPFMETFEFLVSDYNLSDLKFMEIINDPTYLTSIDAMEKALLAWDILLKNGYVVYGIGGSDSHLYPYEKYENSNYPSLLGDPKTFIFVKNLSKDEIKKAMLQGKISVSREKLIELKKIGKYEFTMKLEENTFHNKKIHIELIVDGEIYETYEDNLHVKLNLDKNYHYVRANVRCEDGELYGFTNPYFYNLEKSVKKIKRWKELQKLV
ncbi:CehA/McbA family metallohydrolase [Peptoniphilus sp. AGMB00490]|uniref:CehA/McbA family metallohydrolase n=1 Tax=Peptoniphilus faecalis TaxID=2731255 RepID=A0A848RM80_9FIRM|nr:CehA/McbA family metallohydrolase [Peptoniphilus faecalis]NMW85392.1 CehA/McbA family metallohydrolase [Peptoniphilus faecalis]